MSFQCACRFRPDAPGAAFRDLDDVVLTVAGVGDDSDTIPAGIGSTIVSVSREGEACRVEVAEPEGTPASVGPDEMRLVERARP